jgi:hypothetical protein
MRTRNVLGVACTLLFSMLCFACVAMGQTETATVSGLVTDSTGAVAPGAQIKLQNVERGTFESTTTNTAGIYVFTTVEPGKYQLTVSKPGFKQVDLVGVIVNVQDHIEQNFRLEVGSLSESVTVTAETSNINTTDATVGTVVDRQFAENLPLNGRSFQALIEITPGVVVTPSSNTSQGQFSVNGQRTASNSFSVDGVSMNLGGAVGANLYQFAGGAVPALSAQGGTSGLVSVDAMEEFRILTSTYAPEFGRTPGAQIQIVTRSGTDGFHGTLFEYFRNNKLDANNWFSDELGLPKAEERQNDFGGVLGGPIVKHHTFFFFSYEGLRLRLPTTALSDVPSLSTRAAAPAALQPFLNSYPLPNGPAGSSGDPGLAQFNASYSDPSSLNSYSIRIDHKLTQKVQIFGRFSYAPSETGQRGPDVGFTPSNVLQSNYHTKTLTFGANVQFSDKLTGDFRFNYSTSTIASLVTADNFGGAVPYQPSAFFTSPTSFTTDNTLFGFGIFTGTNTFSYVGSNTSNEQRQTNTVNSISYVIGSHVLKFGVDYRHLSPVFDPREFNTAAFFNDTADVLTDSPLLIQSQASRHGTMFFNNLGVFAQDTWKISRRLTLTYGLRWEIDFTPTLGNGLTPLAVTGFGNLATLALAPAGTPLWQTTYGNVAPRFGLAYQIRQRPGRETVVRGGFGVFYDLSSQQAGQLAEVDYPPFGAQTTYLGPPAGGTATFPLSGSEAQPPPISSTPPVSQVTVFDPNLKEPYTLEWNVSLEQALGSSQWVTASYVGAAGRRLLQQNVVDGQPSPDFINPILIGNSASSNYNALQLQYQRRLTAGLQALASYSWSHSIDTASSSDYNLVTDLAMAGANPNSNRGDSDFDIRQSFSAGLTYKIPTPRGNKALRAVLGDWSTDSIFRARTAPPLTVIVEDLVFAGTNAAVRPDVVPGVPLYLHGDQFPGGKALNPAAFTNPPVGPDGVPLRQGTLGRNALRGFGASEWDFTMRRQFDLGENLHLQFRAELFNVLNHPNFGQPNTLFTTPIGSSFGVATTMLAQSLGQGGLGGGLTPLYQMGGPRSIQLALKLIF